MTTISRIQARQILDSRGNPTVEADVYLDSGAWGRASVPSGASTGTHEAVELRDENPQVYQGKSVHTAVSNVVQKIAPALIGCDAADQTALDQKMIELDSTPNKGSLGANAILAVSMAATRAVASAHNVPLYQYLANYNTREHDDTYLLPIPFMNVINGGKHAPDGVDLQEFMIVPHGFSSFSQALEAGTVVFHTLKKILSKSGYVTLVGDEGGFAPAFSQNKQALDYLIQAITAAGYKPGEQISIGLDPATSEIYDVDKHTYSLKRDNRELSPEDMIVYWKDLSNQYPIVSLEDGLEQDAWENWATLTSQLTGKVQIVGDDFLVTNPARLQKAIEGKNCSAILVKVNQIGTVTEAIQAINLARSNGFGAMVSHRSGETEDSFIADLVVGLQAGQIKTGSLSRGERIAKYNQLLRIEEQLGSKAVFAGTQTAQVLGK